VKVRRGVGTCDDPCILGRFLDSAFMQARVRLSCSNRLIYTVTQAYHDTMIGFITIQSILIPLIEGLCAQTYF